MKKKWGKPSLTVIVRNKPEEAVLTGCKLFPANGPVYQNEMCEVKKSWCEPCQYDAGPS